MFDYLISPKDGIHIIKNSKYIFILFNFNYKKKIFPIKINTATHLSPIGHLHAVQRTPSWNGHFTYKAGL